jgi:hypothetical protein
MKRYGVIIFSLLLNVLFSKELSIGRLLPSEVKEIKSIIVNLDSGSKLLASITDTLRNHDNFSSGVSYFSECSLYTATRLTIPSQVASQCTIKKTRFYVRIPNATSNAPCRFFIYKDTIVNGIHQPGEILRQWEHNFNVTSGGIWSVTFSFTSNPVILNRLDNFWLGMVTLNRNAQIIADLSENSDTTRNNYKLWNDAWVTFDCDFFFEAYVSYEPRDDNIGILSILGEKILQVNTNAEIKALVKNFGRNTLPPGIPIVRYITGPNAFVQYDTGYTLNNLSQNAQETIAFSSVFQPTYSGDYQITIWSAYNLDSLNNNDTVQSEVFAYSHGHHESFDNTIFPPAGWSVANFNNHRSWMRDSFSSRYYTAPAGVVIYYDQAPYWPNNDWFISPRFLASPQDSIIFWYRAGSSLLTETLLVRINFSGTILDTNDFEIVYTIVTNNYQWQKCIIPLSQYLTSEDTLILAFHYPCFNKFYMALDDIIIGPPVRNIDFLVERITAPLLPILADSTYQPVITVRNNSIDNVDFHPVKLYYQVKTTDSILYCDSIEEGIEIGNFADIYFNPWTVSDPETAEIIVWCHNSEDENPINDTITKEIYIAPKYQSIPYSTDFNENWGHYGDNPPWGGWRIIDEGNEYYKAWNTNDWYRDTIRSYNTLRTVAKVYYSPIENQVEKLISPRLNCSIPGVYTLTYWHWYRDWSPLTIDSGLVLISNNDGQTWQRLTRYTNVSDSGYRLHDITSYVSGHKNVRICFLYKARDEWYWCIDDFGVNFMLYAPELRFPRNNLETLANYMEFQWSSVPGATKYHLQIAYDSLFNYLFTSETLSDTTYGTAIYPETYYWRVRAGEPYSLWSETRRLKITEPIVLRGWYQAKRIPDWPSWKAVKDGGRITYSHYDSTIYALKGNNTNDFFAYKIIADTWCQKPSIGMDSLKKRKIKKGSALTYGESYLYVVKGGSNEFWAYDIINDTWVRKQSFPSQLKAGTDIVYVPAQKENSVLQDSRIYLLKGSDKNFEFWAYSISLDTWVRKSDAPRGPKGAPFKDGSGLVFDPANLRIYALKGGTGEFYFYDILNDTWTTYNETVCLPLRVPYSQRNTKPKTGASLAIIDSFIYAIKGGNNEFWRFNINQNVWQAVDSIPKRDPKDVPKAGAHLTAGLGRIYLLKGNNTREFLVYYPYSGNSSLGNERTLTSSVINSVQSELSGSIQPLSFSVNPQITKEFLTIKYTVKSKEPVYLVIDDILGRRLKILKDEIVSPNTIRTLTLNVKELPKGVFFISLITREHTFRKKCIKE